MTPPKSEHSTHADPASAPLIAGSRADIFGISAALVTPFAEDGSVDGKLAATHAQRVLAAGARGITLFGTTGEGASIGMTVRTALLKAVQRAGASPDQITCCVAACAMEQALQQARDCIALGVRRLLLTPPFYFKGVGDAALFEWFVGFIETLDRPEVQIILYHIPQVTGVGLSVPLIRQLKDRFDESIFGVKDSSGDWNNAQALLQHRDLAILIGDERLLAKAAPLGGAGAISGMANLVPGPLTRIIRTGVADPGLDAVVDDVVTHSVTPLVKAMVGAQNQESGWQRVRPPLAPADAAVAAALAARLPAQ